MNESSPNALNEPVAAAAPPRRTPWTTGISARLAVRAAASAMIRKGALVCAGEGNVRDNKEDEDAWIVTQTLPAWILAFMLL